MRIAQQKVAATQYITQVIRWVNMYNGTYPENFGVPEGYTLPPGIPRDWILPPGVKFPESYVYACAPGQTPAAGAPGTGPHPRRAAGTARRALSREPSCRSAGLP